MEKIENISEDVYLRRNDLADAVKTTLVAIPVQISTKDENVLIRLKKLLVCGVVVEKDGYRIFNVSAAWSKKTSYRCEESGNGTWHYYLETVDEVVGEVKRLVMFETAKKADMERVHILDVAEMKKFSTIYGLINDTVGTSYTGWQKGTWHIPGGGPFRIWFPKLARKKDGKYIPSPKNSKSLNILSDDWNKLIYDDLSKKGEDEMYDGSPFYDLIFAKDTDGMYVFRGAFLCDRKESLPNHYVCKRVATKVRLVGSPAKTIELLDKVNCD